MRWKPMVSRVWNVPVPHSPMTALALIHHATVRQHTFSIFSWPIRIDIDAISGLISSDKVVGSSKWHSVEPLIRVPPLYNNQDLWSVLFVALRTFQPYACIQSRFHWSTYLCKRLWSVVFNAFLLGIYYIDSDDCSWPREYFKKAKFSSTCLFDSKITKWTKSLRRSKTRPRHSLRNH